MRGRVRCGVRLEHYVSIRFIFAVRESAHVRYSKSGICVDGMENRCRRGCWPSTYSTSSARGLHLNIFQ